MPNPQNQPPKSDFTGVLLPVFFVADMMASVRFYRDICQFAVLSVHDDARGKEVVDWPDGLIPWFVRLSAAGQEFALHANNGAFDAIGGTKHYFEVTDVDAKFAAICARGGTPDPIQDFPWMRMFSMRDPDGHTILFQTPNSDWRAE